MLHLSTELVLDCTVNEPANESGAKAKASQQCLNNMVNDVRCLTPAGSMIQQTGLVEKDMDLNSSLAA